MSMKQKTRHRIEALEEENRRLRAKLWECSKPNPPPPNYEREYSQMKALHDKVIIQLLDAHKRIHWLESKLDDEMKRGVYG